jgi:hypothetical protein
MFLKDLGATMVKIDGPKRHVYIKFGKKGQEIQFGPLEVEEWIAGHSGHLEPVGRNYKEHFASLQPEGRFDQFVENVVDLTMPAVR